MERAAADLAQGGSESTLKELLKALHSADRYMHYLLHMMLHICCYKACNSSPSIVVVTIVSAAIAECAGTAHSGGFNCSCMCGMLCSLVVAHQLLQCYSAVQLVITAY
jgi:hypothetical protein